MKPDSKTNIVKHSMETPADEVLKHWTTDKMREAQAAPLPSTNALKRRKQRPRRSPRTENPPQD